MIRASIFIILFLFSFLKIEAQNEVAFESVENKFEREKVILSLPLLTQLDFNSPSVGLALDLKVNKWLGVHQELGYINNWLNPFYAALDYSFSDRYLLKNGIKYVVEPRFYPFFKKGTFSSRIFFAPSFDFRYVNIDRKEWVSRNNASYQQFLNYKVDKLAFGGLVKFGFTTKIKKFMPIDFVFGLGARYTYYYNNLPVDAEQNNATNIFFFGNPNIEGEMLHPSAHFGMYLHLPINKK